MGSLLAQNVIVSVNVCVGIITLVYLIKYVRATKGIEKATNEQSEGLSKPSLVLLCGVPVPSEMAILMGVTDARVGAGLLQIVNIGNGPAIQLQCDVVCGRPSGQQARFRHHLNAPYLESRQVFQLPVSLSSLTPDLPCFITCDYMGLSGRRYRSEMELEGDQVKMFKFK